MTKRICTVIPLRIESESAAYRISRLDHLLGDPTWKHHADVMVVDDGSPAEFSARIEAACQKNEFSYVRLDTAHEMFSIARCRNEAAVRAKSRYIFYSDADLVFTDGFFKELDNQIDVLKLENNNNDFIMIPVSYLTEEATRRVASDGINTMKAELFHATYMRDRQVCEKFSSGTSACLYDRYYFLTRGGNRREFGGWGYEDLEFNCRMARLARRFPFPENFQLDRGSFDGQHAYEGFKAMYRLFGDRSLFQGLMLFHAWHPVDKSSSYVVRSHDNRALFQQSLHDFARHGVEPDPLPDHSGQVRTLRFRENPFVKNRQIDPHLGHITLAREDGFGDAAKFGSFLKERGITQVLFHNPYANDQMRMLYDWCRNNEFPIIVAERGALPGSVFYDASGFLADSNRLDPSFWDRELSPEEKDDALDFIRSLNSADRHLEKQGGRLEESAVRQRIDLGPHDKLVLICFQRPGDTATRFFDGKAGAYAKFEEAVSKLASRLPKGFRVAYRIHPLEDALPSIQGHDVSDLHLNDLLPLADRVVMFNSGVGLLAALRGKPVILYGRAFYACDKFNRTVSSRKDLDRAVVEGCDVDFEAVIKLTKYLKDEYYSFGDFTTRDVKMPTGERMTATTSIFFRQINIVGRRVRIDTPGKVRDSWVSMAFDRYQGARAVTRPAVAATPPVAARTVVVSQKTGRVKSVLRFGYHSAKRIPIARGIADRLLRVYLARREGR